MTLQHLKVCQPFCVIPVIEEILFQVKFLWHLHDDVCNSHTSTG